MSQSPRRRPLAVAFVALCLLPPAAQARALRPSGGHTAWSLALSFFTPWAVHWFAEPKAGCSADPSGLCKTAAPGLPTWREACSADPSGRSAVPNIENGCSADPSGAFAAGH